MTGSPPTTRWPTADRSGHPTTRRGLVPLSAKARTGRPIAVRPVILRGSQPARSSCPDATGWAAHIGARPRPDPCGSPFVVLPVSGPGWLLGYEDAARRELLPAGRSDTLSVSVTAAGDLARFLPTKLTGSRDRWWSARPRRPAETPSSHPGWPTSSWTPSPPGRLVVVESTLTTAGVRRNRARKVLRTSIVRPSTLSLTSWLPVRREVLCLIARGYTYREVARELSR